MNKILFAVLAVAMSISAATISAPTSYGQLGPWVIDTAWNADAADTVSGADTTVLSNLTKRRFEPGYEYAMMTSFSIESADTIRFEALSYGCCGDTLFDVTSFDTLMSGQTDRISLMPIGRTSLGYKYTIRAIGWIESLLTTIERIEIWKRELN